MPEMIDITVPYTVDLPLWPGDPKPRMDFIKCISNGSRCNVSRIEAGVHFGTHLDAPCHFIEGGKSVDELDLAVLVGECILIEVSDVQAITTQHLQNAAIPPGTERLLIKTKNSQLWANPKHKFKRDFAAITPDAAKWIVENKIKLIGIDYLSVQLFNDRVSTTHLVLLKAETVIVEALDLRLPAPGKYKITCLPLKLVGADGAPVRAFLETI
tara:strand:- start:340 stop:978 length:639 start_codon:yes stop_codon:yes gene_type:complete